MDGNSPSGTVVIAGGSGFLGVSLDTHLAAAGTSKEGFEFRFPDLGSALADLLAPAR